MIVISRNLEQIIIQFQYTRESSSMPVKGQHLSHQVHTIRQQLISGADQIEILKNLDLLSLTVSNLERQHLNSFETLRLENQKHQVENHKMKKLNKNHMKLAEENTSLRLQVNRDQEFNKNKIQKLLKKECFQSQRKYSMVDEQNQVVLEVHGTQCEILSGQLYQDLRKENEFLIKKIQRLQKLYEDQRNQNQASKLYVTELVRALEKDEQEEEENSMGCEEESQTQRFLMYESVASDKDVDRSTLPADSQKSQRFQQQNLDDQKKLVEAIQEEDEQESEPEQPECFSIVEEEISRSLWGTLWHKSNDFLSTIFRSQ